MKERTSKVVKALEKLWIQLKSATESIAASDVSAIDSNRPYDERHIGKTQSPTTSRDACPLYRRQWFARTVIKPVEGMGSEKQEDIMIKSKVALESALRDIATDFSLQVERM